MNKPKSIYFENLDTLRFFCFLSVFLCHSFATNYSSVSSSGTYQFIKMWLLRNGNLGVNFFFVLSGFLITHQLLSEKNSTGRINIKYFYFRRILRIWPLFYFCVFFGFVVFKYLKAAFGGVPNETAHPIYYMFFLNNLDYLRYSTDASVLAILWSIAIEEQFYLVWPLLILLTPQKSLPFLFTAILIFSFSYRLYYAGNAPILYLGTFSCISDLCIGAFGAYLTLFSGRFRWYLKNLNPVVIILIYLGCASVFLFRQQLFNHGHIMIALDRLIISILFLGVILEQNVSKRSFIKFKKLSLFSTIGKYTYGLYCLHMIAILIVSTLLNKFGLNKQTWQVFILEGSLSFLLSLGFGYISFRYFEKPFLNLKERFKVKPGVRPVRLREDAPVL